MTDTPRPSAESPKTEAGRGLVELPYWDGDPVTLKILTAWVLRIEAEAAALSDSALREALEVKSRAYHAAMHVGIGITGGTSWELCGHATCEHDRLTLLASPPPEPLSLRGRLRRDHAMPVADVAAMSESGAHGTHDAIHGTTWAWPHPEPLSLDALTRLHRFVNEHELRLDGGPVATYVECACGGFFEPNVWDKHLALTAGGEK